ncbi:DUF4327 domain-containing protein [Stenomitos frigidus ULC18]|uniref:DUF4327 domain-containing protein n=2 Tax=Stenomitos TaxID=1844270 RepID=A0A2T1E0Q0_9CYAN|nr:DUF4327 domain-containing protein [Stenomitos frigidus ULC18]
MTAHKVTAFSIDALRDDVRHLVEKGTVSRYQPIYTLCRYIPYREWLCAERELESNNYLLRDPVIDLLGREDWTND